MMVILLSVSFLYLSLSPFLYRSVLRVVAANFVLQMTDGNMRAIELEWDTRLPLLHPCLRILELKIEICNNLVISIRTLPCDLFRR